MVACRWLPVANQYELEKVKNSKKNADQLAAQHVEIEQTALRHLKREFEQLYQVSKRLGPFIERINQKQKGALNHGPLTTPKGGQRPPRPGRRRH